MKEFLMIVAFIALTGTFTLTGYRLGNAEGHDAGYVLGYKQGQLHEHQEIMKTVEQVRID